MLVFGLITLNKQYSYIQVVTRLSLTGLLTSVIDLGLSNFTDGSEHQIRGKGIMAFHSNFITISFRIFDENDKGTSILFKLLYSITFEQSQNWKNMTPFPPEYF